MWLSPDVRMPQYYTAVQDNHGQQKRLLLIYQGSYRHDDRDKAKRNEVPGNDTTMEASAASCRLSTVQNLQRAVPSTRLQRSDLMCTKEESMTTEDK